MSPNLFKPFRCSQSLPPPRNPPSLHRSELTLFDEPAAASRQAGPAKCDRCFQGFHLTKEVTPLWGGPLGSPLSGQRSYPIVV